MTLDFNPETTYTYTACGQASLYYKHPGGYKQEEQEFKVILDSMRSSSETILGLTIPSLQEEKKGRKESQT